MELESVQPEKQNPEKNLAAARDPFIAEKQGSLAKMRNENTQQNTGNTPHRPDIIIRLQKNTRGIFSSAYDRDVIYPRVTSAKFFAWFGDQTGYGGPSGPAELKFTFVNALPEPIVNIIGMGNEGHFGYMRQDIKVQYEKALSYMPDMKEFTILVTAPNWVPFELEYEEEW